MIKGEDSPRQVRLTNQQISEIMSAAISRQRPYVFVFAFTGGAQQFIMCHCHFFLKLTSLILEQLSIIVVRQGLMIISYVLYVAE